MVFALFSVTSTLAAEKRNGPERCLGNHLRIDSYRCVNTLKHVSGSDVTSTSYFTEMCKVCVCVCVNSLATSCCFNEKVV